MQKRFDAVCKISDRRTEASEPQGAKLLDFFAADVFDNAKMAEHLPKTTYKKLIATINGMQPLDASIADEVATPASLRGMGRTAHVVYGDVLRACQSLDVDGSRRAVHAVASQGLCLVHHAARTCAWHPVHARCGIGGG